MEARGIEPLPGLSTALAKRITEVCWLRVRDTGLGQEQATTMRAELESRVAECLNHFQSTAPEEVAQLERKLERYDRRNARETLDRSRFTFLNY